MKKEKKQMVYYDADGNIVNVNEKKETPLLKYLLYFILKNGMVVLCAWLLLYYVFAVGIATGTDMEPGIGDGDIYISYKLSEPRSGDVACVEKNGKQFLARVIGRENDVIDLTDDGRLIVNDAIQQEEIFFATNAREGGMEFPYKLKEGEWFVLGDYRPEATDSRAFGPVKDEEMRGVVVAVLRRRNI